MAVMKGNTNERINLSTIAVSHYSMQPGDEDKETLMTSLILIRNTVFLLVKQEGGAYGS